VSPALLAALVEAAGGDIAGPMASARALARVIAARRDAGQEPLTFGMTFPFSNHNYQLRFWMAAGGVDPDEDVRLVVLPPPYMVDSLAKGHVDAFCVGAPWNSMAVELGIGHILHFGSEIVARDTEKVLAVRESWAAEHPDMLLRLVRAHDRAARFIADPANGAEVAALVAAPGRVGVPADVLRRTLEGRLKVAHDGTTRTDPRYLLIGREGAARPDPVQAAWAYAQMVRWRQAPLTPALLAMAEAVYRPDLYDAAVGAAGRTQAAPHPRDGVGAFAGPAFDAADPAGYLAAWQAKGPRPG
jgi:NitT/TauT family transport system ATP-binding protein